MAERPSQTLVGSNPKAPLRRGTATNMKGDNMKDFNMIKGLAGARMSFYEALEVLDDMGLSYREFISARNSRILRRRCKAKRTVAVARGEETVRISLHDGCSRERAYFLVWGIL